MSAPAHPLVVVSLTSQRPLPPRYEQKRKSPMCLVGARCYSPVGAGHLSPRPPPLRSQHSCASPIAQQEQGAHHDSCSPHGSWGGASPDSSSSGGSSSSSSRQGADIDADAGSPGPSSEQQVIDGYIAGHPVRVFPGCQAAGRTRMLLLPDSVTSRQFRYLLLLKGHVVFHYRLGTTPV